MSHSVLPDQTLACVSLPPIKPTFCLTFPLCSVLFSGRLFAAAAAAAMKPTWAAFSVLVLLLLSSSPAQSRPEEEGEKKKTEETKEETEIDISNLKKEHRSIDFGGIDISEELFQAPKKSEPSEKAGLPDGRKDITFSQYTFRLILHFCKDLKTMTSGTSSYHHRTRRWC
jgi:hypothetical protein